MYIMTQDGKQIIDSDFVERFAVAVKPDATLIIASYTSGDDKKPVTMGRYVDEKQAEEELTSLFFALADADGGGVNHYHMPAKTYIEREKKDARTKRRGKS